MKTLSTRFINDTDLISRLIDWETNSLFCHAEGLSRDGRHWVGAHAGSGVQARPFNWCRPTFERVYTVEVSDMGYDSAMAFQESKIGCPYNYGDIIGLMVRNRKLGASDHSVICSAFETERLMAAGLYPLNCMEGFAYLITPEMLHLSPMWIGRRDTALEGLWCGDVVVQQKEVVQ